MLGRSLGVVESLSVGASLPVFREAHHDHRVARSVVVHQAVLAVDVLQRLGLDDLLGVVVVAAVGHLVGDVVVPYALELGQLLLVDHARGVHLACGERRAQQSAVALYEGSHQRVGLQREGLLVELRAVLVVAANEVEVYLCAFLCSGERDDGLSVLFADGDGRRVSLVLQVDSHLGHLTQQIAVAQCHSLDGALGGDVDRLGVEGALECRLAAVEGVEYLRVGHGALQRDVGVHLVVGQRDGGLRSSGDGGLRVGQHRHGVVDELCRCDVSQHLLCVGQIDVSVVSEVVGVYGNHLFILVCACQHWVVGKHSAE